MAAFRKLSKAGSFCFFGFQFEAHRRVRRISGHWAWGVRPEHVWAGTWAAPGVQSVELDLSSSIERNSKTKFSAGVGPAEVIDCCENPFFLLYSGSQTWMVLTWVYWVLRSQGSPIRRVPPSWRVFFSGKGAIRCSPFGPAL